MQHKERVKVAFDKAAEAYQSRCYVTESRHQSLQQQAAQLLFQELQTHKLGHHIVDLGCGPGVHAPRLAPHSVRYTGIDIAPNMIQVAASRMPDLDWLVGDAEALPLAQRCCSSVFSNLALQWCISPQVVADELNRILLPSGRLWLSTLVEGSLWPLNELYEQGLLSAVNQYPTKDIWQHALVEAGFRVETVAVYEVTTWHGSAQAALHSMKDVGASVSTERNVEVGMRGKQWLQSLCKAYERYQQPSGMPLKYNVLVLSACKRE
ncbi:MAG: methyltransferase domain-containing protein [Idiomarina sp.]|nr:methyltransferase domain-containing protein [Idiomarina sp.]